MRSPKISHGIKIVLITAILSFLSLASAHASDDDIPYLARIPYRIARGATNVALGWTEVFLRPFGEHKTESVGEAMATGAVNSMIRFSSGILDITTFWVPDIQMLDLYPDWEGWPYLFHWS